MPDTAFHETLTVTSSPRLNTFIHDLSKNQPDALTRFWEQVEIEGTPLIEMADGDSNSCIVTFLWRATDDLQQVLMIIDTLTDQYRRVDLTPCMMQQIEGTDIWHISYHLRTDLRATYHFYPVRKQQPLLSTAAKTREEWIEIVTHSLPDPYNDAAFPGRLGDSRLSVLELPQAPPQPWWRMRPNVAQGTLTEHRLRSALLGNERRIWVYQPAAYAPDHEPYPLLLMLDGQVWVQSASIQTTLDNLMDAAAIPPLIAVAVDSLDSETRAAELTCNPLFTQFLTDELLPWMQQRWSITDDPARTIIAGQSFGGLASVFAAFHASQRFGNALSQSGSLWWKEDDPTHEASEWLVRQYAMTDKLPLRFYVAVGWQEWMMLTPNRHLRDVLTAKGYPLIYHEYNGGHDYICWRGDIAAGLIALVQSWHTDSEPCTVPAAMHDIHVTARSTIPPQKPKSPPPEVIESPRILALKAEIEQGNRAALSDFWATVATEGTPLVEPMAHDPEHSIVTFLWRGDADIHEVIILANKFTDATVFDASVMKQLLNSDVWHRSYRVRSDWRASYKLAPVRTSGQKHMLGAYASRLVERAIAVGSPVPRARLERWWSALEHAIPDPYNNKRFQGHSVVELPNAPVHHGRSPQHNLPAGSVTAHTIYSQHLGNERRVSVYTPTNYSSSKHPYGLLVMLDGQSWIKDHPLAPMLDALIAQGKLPPLVAILPEALDFETRVREMACHPPFVQFISGELLPWAAATWNITHAPECTIIAGQSLGGLTAAFAGLRAPQRFGNVLSQSGSFWWANGSEFDVDGEWLAQQYARMPKRALRFYIEVGLQEWVLLPPTRHLRNVLEAKGYDITYNEFNGGHDEVCFRGSIADGLLALTRDWPRDS